MKFYIVRVSVNGVCEFKKAFPTRKKAESWFDWYKNKFAQNHIVHTDLDILVEKKITWAEDDDTGNNCELSLYRCGFKKVNKKNICFLVNFNEQFYLN